MNQKKKKRAFGSKILNMLKFSERLLILLIFFIVEYYIDFRRSKITAQALSIYHFFFFF